MAGFCHYRRTCNWRYAGVVILTKTTDNFQGHTYCPIPPCWMHFGIEISNIELNLFGRSLSILGDNASLRSMIGCDRPGVKDLLRRRGYTFQKTRLHPACGVSLSQIVDCLVSWHNGENTVIDLFVRSCTSRHPSMWFGASMSKKLPYMQGMMMNKYFKTKAMFDNKTALQGMYIHSSTECMVPSMGRIPYRRRSIVHNSIVPSMKWNPSRRRSISCKC